MRRSKKRVGLILMGEKVRDFLIGVFPACFVLSADSTDDYDPFLTRTVLTVSSTISPSSTQLMFLI